MSLKNLQHKHPGETCWIVGKGPSLRYLRAEHFGAGPVIAISHAIMPVQALGLPNPIYLWEKDGRDGFEAIREDVTIILQVGEGYSEHLWPSHPLRVLVDPVTEMDFLEPEMSVRMALRISQEMGCEQVVFVCCDSLCSEEYRRLEVASGEVVEANVGAYLRIKGIILEDLTEIPHTFIVPEGALC